MNSTAPQGLIQISPGFRFQWEEVQQAYVLLFPEGMITLNASSAEILKRCDGTRTAAEIVSDLQRQFPDADLSNDVHEFLEVAHDKGWIRGR